MYLQVGEVAKDTKRDLVWGTPAWWLQLKLYEERILSVKEENAGTNLHKGTESTEEESASKTNMN